MKRQVFKRGQKVFICTLQASKYNLAVWIPAKVTNPEPKKCPNKGISYHICYPYLHCKSVPNPHFVDIVKLNQNGKRITASWGGLQVRNVRSVILSEEEAQPVLIEVAARKVHRERTTIKRVATSTVQYRMERAAVPMAKVLKKIQVNLNSYPRPSIRDETIKTIITEVLELLKVPKKNKAR